MANPTYATHVGFAHTVDEEAYHTGGSSTGWTLVSAARNYIEADDTAGALSFNTGRAFTPLTNVWMSCSLLRHVGQIATSAEIAILKFRAALSADACQVSILQSTDNDHFVIRLRQEGGPGAIIGTGTVELAVDTDFTLLIWMDGTKLRMKVNSTEDDINVAHTGQIDNVAVQGLPDVATLNDLQTGDKLRIGPIAIHHSNDSADRPGVNIGDDMVVYPDGDKEQGYGDHTNCGILQTGGTYTYIDDWASGVANDGTDFVCEEAGSSNYYMATMTTVTVSNNFTGGRLITKSRANVTEKTVSVEATIRDNDGTPNEIQKFLPNLGDTTWATRSIEFPNAPDGGAWSQDELTNLNCGYQSAGANGANDQHTALMFEVCTIDADPPPAADRRRTMGFVS